MKYLDHDWLPAIVFMWYCGHFRNTNKTKGYCCKTISLWHSVVTLVYWGGNGEPLNILISCISNHKCWLWSYPFASRASCFVSVGERDSGVAKVEEWQRTMYNVDSGFQSGATTVKDDDGDYGTKHYTMTTTTVTREEPGKTTSSMHILPPLP